ncbi:MAG: hypothetical protein HYT13_00525 [Candidatus Liptonbacteria bacterium]|nr:hypothetical protein [Candidatus Liptonbacteria bacterium]
MNEKEKFSWAQPEDKKKREEEAAEHTQAMEEIYAGLPDDKDELLRMRRERENEKVNLTAAGTTERRLQLQDQLTAINRKLRDLGVEEE